MTSKQLDRWFWFVKHLPKKLIYFCAMQMVIEATGGKFGNTIVPEITFIEAIKRYADKHNI